MAPPICLCLLQAGCKLQLPPPCWPCPGPQIRYVQLGFNKACNQWIRAKPNGKASSMMGGLNFYVETATKRRGVPANVCNLLPHDFSQHLVLLASAEFTKPSSPAALDVAFAIGHDRVPAHGSAEMPRQWRAATPASATTAGGGWPAARLALPCVRSGITEQM